MKLTKLCKAIKRKLNIKEIGYKWDRTYNKITVYNCDGYDDMHYPLFTVHRNTGIITDVNYNGYGYYCIRDKKVCDYLIGIKSVEVDIEPDPPHTRIYKDDKLQHDFVFVRNTKTGEEGAWDYVECKFYKDTRSGNANQEITRKVPEFSDYQRLEYITSTDNQYIDTGMGIVNIPDTSKSCIDYIRANLNKKDIHDLLDEAERIYGLRKYKKELEKDEDVQDRNRTK